MTLKPEDCGAGCPYPQCRKPEIVAERAAEKVLKEVFAILGVNVDEPKEVEDFRQVLRFSKGLRRVTVWGMLAMATTIGGSIVYAVWVGLKANVLGFLVGK